MSRERRQPLKLPVMVEGECDWCGGHIEGDRHYCSPECRGKYNNLQAAQGKSVVQAVKLWSVRQNSALYDRTLSQTIFDRAADFNREDRERKARLMGGELTKEE